MQILELFGVTVIKELECELFGRDGGKGGNDTLEFVVCSRRGKGSVLPIVVISVRLSFDRIFVMGMDCIDEFFVDFEINVPDLSLRCIGDFFGKVGCSC